MKVLVTGFDPFGGESVNPAWEAVKALPDSILGAQIIKRQVPTVFGKSGDQLEGYIKEFMPDFVLCVGQAGGRSGISFEKVAINFAEARIADNEGNQPIDEAIRKNGENAYFTNLPIKAMVLKLQENHIPSSISYTAGTFVCNDIMYRLLYFLKQTHPQGRGGFVHVPFIPEQVVNKADGTPSMSLDMIVRGLKLAIETMVSKEEQKKVAMGTID